MGKIIKILLNKTRCRRLYKTPGMGDEGKEKGLGGFWKQIKKSRGGKLGGEDGRCNETLQYILCKRPLFYV